MRKLTSAKKKDDFSQKILQLAGNTDPKTYWRIKEISEEIVHKNPLIKQSNIKKEVLKQAIEEGYDSLDASRYYDSIQNSLLPWLKSGEKLLSHDALMEYLIDKAKDHLMEDVYNKNGDAVGQKFSVETMNAIVKASKAQMDVLTKFQTNIITAQEKAGKKETDNEFNIKDAEREQLERFISGELSEHPDIVEKLLNSSEKEILGFYESNIT